MTNNSAPLRLVRFPSRLTIKNRGQYSDAVLSELENQNDEQLEGMSARVKMLKDVRPLLCISPQMIGHPDVSLSLDYCGYRGRDS